MKAVEGRGALGRTLTETRVATTTAFGWDPLSNLTSVTPPGKPAHGMTCATTTRRCRATGSCARDALVTLLLERMRTVRTLVRFVFREHPALVRKATSDYERKRKRKNARRRATAKKRSATPVNA
jgi:YD repeat-containing protein